MTEDPVRVIYILSFSRSGSTVLDAILGNAPGAVGTGELGRVAVSGWIGGQICSCGQPAPDCPFWSGVYEKWQAYTGATAQDYAALQDRFERLRRMPALLRQKIRPSEDFQRYAALTRDILRAVQAESGAAVIVDSSKNPARALALSLMDGIDLTVVHLARDVRGVCRSLAKPYRRDVAAGIENDMKGEPVAKTALSWAVLNRVMAWTARQAKPGRALFVRYEDLMAAPAFAVESILQAAGFSPGAYPLALKEGADIPAAAHTIAGNRLRMGKTITIRRDAGWERDMPEKQKRQALFWSLGGRIGGGMA